MVAAVTEAVAPSAVDLLVFGPAAVTMDDAGRVIEDAVIVISGGRIVWIGPAQDAPPFPAPAARLDARGLIALPGLVDAHVHLAQQPLRGLLAELSRRGPPRMPPWKHYWLPFEATLSPEEVRFFATVACANMLLNGTTCFLEAGGPHPDEMALAAEEVGIRGFVALSTIDSDPAPHRNPIPPAAMLATDEALERNIALVRRWNRPGARVGAWMALRQIMVCTPELTRDMAEAARAEGTRLHVHLAEGAYEIDFALEVHGARPAHHLERLGALGPQLHAAHSVILLPEEVDLYVRRSVSACHCSMNNFGIGVPRLQEMWRRGVAVGLGSDGAASADTLDIFRIAHAARIGQAAQIGHVYQTRTPMGAEELLRIATRGGARAAGLAQEIGMLAAGFRADLILVDPSDADCWGTADPLYIAAHCIVGRDVRHVIVDGRVVVKDRALLTVDLDRLRSAYPARRASALARLTAPTGAAW